MNLEPSTRESVAEMLRTHGITPTHQRIEIALVLLEKRWHPSADQILAAVNVRCAETSKATVYNTLKLFLDKGLVRELIVDPNKVFYDSNTSVHHHFYDVASGADLILIQSLRSLLTGSVIRKLDRCRGIVRSGLGYALYPNQRRNYGAEQLFLFRSAWELPRGPGYRANRCQTGRETNQDPFLEGRVREYRDKG